MNNGNAFRTFTDEVGLYLAGLKVVIYYAEPLPSVVDERLRGIVARFMKGTAVECEAFQQSLAPEQRSLFGIYGHWAATLAVRQTSRNWLLSGLIGAVIANYVIPAKRNVEVSLAVYYHCAQKIDESPEGLFAEAAQFARPGLAEKVAAFGRRTDVHLKQFGWQEQKTPDGVRYKFVW
ncbi:MAG: hypothetical protein IPM53_06125 [Anaerolineaceae bacterium]|nr:hypothetical protein [Anaerolineaceae bacterium]